MAENNRSEFGIKRLDQFDRVLNQIQNQLRVGIESDDVAVLFGEGCRELENVIWPIELRVVDEFDAVDKVSNDQEERNEQNRTQQFDQSGYFVALQ